MLGGGVVRAVRLRRRSAARRAGCADCRPHCGSDGDANADAYADGDPYACSLRNAYAYGNSYPYARADSNADADLYACSHRNAYADSDPTPTPTPTARERARSHLAEVVPWIAHTQDQSHAEAADCRRSMERGYSKVYEEDSAAAASLVVGN